LKVTILIVKVKEIKFLLKTFFKKNKKIYHQNLQFTKFYSILIKGKDDLVVCSVNGENRTIEHYHTYLNSTRALVDDVVPLFGITNTSVCFKNGILKCSFNRPINSSDDFFNLHKSYYLIFSNGTFVNGKKNIYSNRQMTSVLV